MDWKTFSQDPFGFVDKISLRWIGREWNILKDAEGNRKIALIAGFLALACWMAFGFDSTPLQFIHVIYEGIPAAFSGSAGWPELLGIYNSYYGKEMHYSAFVIYLLLYFGVSYNLDRAGIKGARNVLYSFTAMFLSISIFEWFWIQGFSYFQGQAWVSTWKWPQLRILLQNTLFSLLGALGLLYFWLDSYILKERFDPGKQKNTHDIVGRKYLFNLKSPWLWLIIGISAAAALLWIYYPGPVEQIQVTLENGQIWESSRLFPQTLYTVDLNPADMENAGVWFWVENNSIHAINTAVKAIWALATYQLFKVKHP